MSKNLPGAKKKSRHFRLRLNDVREMVADRKMDLRFVRTHANAADFYTKPVEPKLFLKFRDWIMGQQRMPIIGTSGYPTNERCEDAINLSIDEDRRMFVGMLAFISNERGEAIDNLIAAVNKNAYVMDLDGYLDCGESAMF